MGFFLTLILTKRKTAKKMLSSAGLDNGSGAGSLGLEQTLTCRDLSSTVRNIECHSVNWGMSEVSNNEIPSCLLAGLDCGVAVHS